MIHSMYLYVNTVLADCTFVWSISHIYHAMDHIYGTLATPYLIVLEGVAMKILLLYAKWHDLLVCALKS